jgi:hypothetical protein
VAELSALIDKFLKDTGAIVPLPNPNYRGGPVPADAITAGDWQARGASEKTSDGEWYLTPTGADPFLGLGAGGIEGRPCCACGCFHRKPRKGEWHVQPAPRPSNPTRRTSPTPGGRQMERV